MINFKIWKFDNHFMIRARNTENNKYYGFRVNRKYESDIAGNVRLREKLKNIVTRESANEEAY